MVMFCDSQLEDLQTSAVCICEPFTIIWSPVLPFISRAFAIASSLRHCGQIARLPAWSFWRAGRWNRSLLRANHVEKPGLTRLSSMDTDTRRKKKDEEDRAASSDEEGIDLMNSEGDSSEEESDEDPEEEARIREGEQYPDVKL
jgi:hypothetical protein